MVATIEGVAERLRARFGSTRRALGAGLTLVLAVGLFMSSFSGARPTGAADCLSVGRGAASTDLAPVTCQANLVQSASLRAEVGDAYVALRPVDVLVLAAANGNPIYRSLLTAEAGQQQVAEKASRFGRLELASYTVQEGDTLSAIAERFKIDVLTLLWTNELSKDAPLAIGRVLLVPPVAGVVHRVEAGETISALAERYGADLEKAAQVNGLVPPYNLTVGQRLLLPGGKPPTQPAESSPAEAPSRPAPPRDAEVPQPAQVLASNLEGPTGSPLPRPPGANPQRAAFILTAAEAARESQGKTGVPASVTIAQAILESDWGASRLSREFHNYFGIKGTARPGTAGVIWFDTWEVIDGQNVTQRAPFRAYLRAADSFIDHGLFFHQNPRYAAALAARNDPRQFAREINKAGYATDPNYAPKLISLMDRYDLYAYDLR